MAMFYLIRHGEPDYEAVSSLGFFGFGRSFAPLSAKGIEQVNMSSEDSRLQEAQLIVSSPYTRALQTAAIISRKINKEIIVEPELHEWMPDKTNSLSSGEEADRLCKEFKQCKGVYPQGCIRKWETLESLQTRMRRVADKYAAYDKVIMVGHGMAFRTLKYIEKMPPAGIVECVYEKGQANVEYFFS